MPCVETRVPVCLFWDRFSFFQACVFSVSNVVDGGVSKFFLLSSCFLTQGLEVLKSKRSSAIWASILTSNPILVLRSDQALPWPSKLRLYAYTTTATTIHFSPEFFKFLVDFFLMSATILYMFHVPSIQYGYGCYLPKLHLVGNFYSNKKNILARLQKKYPVWLWRRIKNPVCQIQTFDYIK